MIDEAIVVARLIHILGGIVWVGAMVFVTVFLIPAIRDTGPDGGKVMAALGKRRFMQVMPALAIVTLLSGIYLYWRVSAGFEMGYMKSGPGHAYAIGGLFAILAFVLGLTVTRPAMMKSMALAQSAPTAPEAERPAIIAKADALRTRGAKAGVVIVWLLVSAAALMAVGRYL
jgi:uncharacterized membrane protein